MEPTMEAGVEAGRGTKPGLGPVVQIDEGRIKAHLDEVVVRATVEETLNALLDAEAERQLHTKAGEVTLTVPKLRSLPFETAIIEAG